MPHCIRFPKVKFRRHSVLIVIPTVTNPALPNRAICEPGNHALSGVNRQCLINSWHCGRANFPPESVS